MARDRLGDFPGGVAPTDGLVPSGEGVRAVSNIVFMGMGEPLYNFDDGARRDRGHDRRRRTLALQAAHHRLDFRRRARDAMLGAECGSMLAVSLHATNDALRDEFVPLNRKYPIAQLMEACRDYPGAPTPGASHSNM